MNRRFLLTVAWVAVLAIPTGGWAQTKKGGPLAPADALKALQVADGFQVELFAAEPLLMNPTSIDVDHKGRVWVAEAVNYRRVAFNRPILRPEGDRIVVLVDEKGTGQATKAVTFYQSRDLVAPLGICVAPYPDGRGQRVYVAHAPDLLVFEDRDDDLQADGPPKKLLSGFRGFDHDHGLHGLSIGPDGKLYFTVGDSGVDGLQSADGLGRKWKSNDSDCRAGTVWRCDLDGTNLELIAHNFRNNYECCVDSFGEIWLSDNDDDGNQQTRICYVMPGGNYGFHPRGPGQSHWHEEQPGIVHKVLRTGFGSPTGIAFYEGTLFGPKYTGALLHCDAGPREVRWFFRKARGAGYELDKEVLLTSRDNWFRPSDVAVAPDGSIFVADWYDRGVGGHGMGDPFDGRIYRITPRGHKGYTVPEVKPQTNDGLLAALASPNLATLHIAMTRIRQLGENDSTDFLSEALREDQPAWLTARANWAEARRLMDMKHPNIGPLLQKRRIDRIQRVRISREIQKTLGEKAAALAFVAPMSEKSSDAAFIREWLLTLRDAPVEVVKPAIIWAAQQYDGRDHFYRAALNIACGLETARRDAILADFDQHFPEWNDKVADLVWELRPKSVLPRLGQWLADEKISAAQKARIVEIIAANEDLAAGRTMLEVLQSPAAPEVKTRALQSLRWFIPTKWKGLQGSPELATAIDRLLREDKTRLMGLQLIAASAAVHRVADVEKIARDEAAPLELRQEAIRTLGMLPSEPSVDALIALGAPKNALTIDCVKALGELLPKGAKPPVYAQKALEALQMAITLKSSTTEIRSAALAALAANRTGTIWLLDMHQKGELPQELVAEAGRLLRNSPFQGERNRALLLFPAPGKLNPKNLPPIAQLAQRSGDPVRGRAVWNASLTGAAQCAKCHMVRGVGGQVGPDLSMIGKKSAREALYESLLYPSKAIADQYVQHQVLTTSEVTLTGLLVAETPQSITLRDANGKDTTIARNEIVGDIRKLKISLMPDDIIAALSEEELVDLVAYLETLKVPALTPETFAIVGPFPGQSMLAALDTAFGPELQPFDPKAQFGAKNPTDRNKLSWQTIRPNGQGYFDLAARHGPAATNSASYMYAEVESPVEQEAEILLGPDDGARLWVNDKEVFTTRETKAALPEAHKIRVKLTKGANTLLLKVANGNNPHGFYFALTSPEEIKLLKK
ncbi:MAG: c-type cytochrome [Gemmataceae bacterium]|nr:c-type cytochrome [Gemmata sp.]MDW8196723.1 c-type cytochrome [Gemmataceae bacterium]